MAQQNFDLIVFDWDGTLMNSTVHITRSIQAACRDLGLPVPDDISASYVIGLGLRDALEIAVPTLKPEDYPKLTERYRVHYLAGDRTTELFVGVREMLTDLRGLFSCRGDRQKPCGPESGAGRGTINGHVRCDALRR